MSIASIVTRGYSTGTSDSSIALVVTRGYSIGDAVVVVPTVDLEGGPRYGSEQKRRQVRVQEESLVTILVAVINDHQS